MTKEQFKCPCCGQNEISNDLVDRLNGIESECHVKLHVNSGYRCEKHNKEVGGLPDSSHIYGLAADIKCMTSSLRSEILHYADVAEINRVGIGKSFIHLDIDTSKPKDVVWLY